MSLGRTLIGSLLYGFCRAHIKPSIFRNNFLGIEKELTAFSIFEKMFPNMDSLMYALRAHINRTLFFIKWFKVWTLWSMKLKARGYKMGLVAFAPDRIHTLGNWYYYSIAALWSDYRVGHLMESKRCVLRKLVGCRPTN